MHTSYPSFLELTLYIVLSPLVHEDASLNQEVSCCDIFSSSRPLLAFHVESSFWEKNFQMSLVPFCANVTCTLVPTCSWTNQDIPSTLLRTCWLQVGLLYVFLSSNTS